MPPKWKAHRKWLIQNGYELVRSEKHVRYQKWVEGIVLTTSVSHGDGEIPLRTWYKILKQLGLSEEEYHRKK